jgi:DNA-binding transcriptional MocR family regulator
MSAANFSETVESALPVSPLQDSRNDFGVVFIHSRLDDYGLTPQQFRVYAHLARRAGSGAAFPAVATIARICQLHAQTVRQALRVLVAHRLITREPRPGTTPLYRLTPASHWQPPTRITGNPSESDTPPSVSESTPTKRMESKVIPLKVIQ